jgi:hypothetical protein
MSVFFFELQSLPEILHEQFQGRARIGLNPIPDRLWYAAFSSTRMGTVRHLDDDIRRGMVEVERSCPFRGEINTNFSIALMCCHRLSMTLLFRADGRRGLRTCSRLRANVFENGCAAEKEGLVLRVHGQSVGNPKCESIVAVTQLGSRRFWVIGLSRIPTLFS